MNDERSDPHSSSRFNPSFHFPSETSHKTVFFRLIPLRRIHNPLIFKTKMFEYLDRSALREYFNLTYVNNWELLSFSEN